ncbi:hypothetical protein LP420_39545 [Massilia sp. B-10]|nr:hypothetical protein LP420_39545 [Massilia sp. B-10]
MRPASTLAADNLSCKAGYQKNAKGRCIAECAAGYTNSGEACVRAADTVGVDAMVCKAGETRTGGRCFPANGKCASGEVLQGGLCYFACPVEAAKASAPLAWLGAPKAWARCGLGAGKDAAACAALSLDQVASVRQLALVFGMNGVTGATPQAPCGCPAEEVQGIERRLRQGPGPAEVQEGSRRLGASQRQERDHLADG